MKFSSCPIFATVLSFSLVIGIGAGSDALATATAAKHKAVKAKSSAPAPVVVTAPTKAAPPQAALPPNRIHNMMLPVPTITERLIRDIMVGKPQETPPPVGTEAFSNEEGAAANGQAASAQTPQVAPAQSVSDNASQPSAPNAETPPAGEVPAGMAPDAVVPLKQELKPEESDKPQEKSQSPLGKTELETAFDNATTADGLSTGATAFGQAQPEPEKAVPEQCAAPALHDFLGDSPKQPTATTSNPEDSSTELDSAGTASGTAAAAETQAATVPLAESPRERIPADGLEEATYAIKTNGGFGSSMVSRQSIPIETAIEPVTTNGAPKGAIEGEEVDLDSAVSPGSAMQEAGNGQASTSNGPVAVATSPASQSNEETVMDAATSDERNGELKANVKLDLPSGSILGDIDKEIRTK